MTDVEHGTKDSVKKVLEEKIHEVKEMKAAFKEHIDG